MSIIPQINSTGFFQVKSPWQMPENTIYTCIAVRDFSDFTAIGENVFDLVYKPKNIPVELYQADVAAGAKIITLASRTQPTIYIPSTYLTGYPLMDNVAYSHVVLGVSLGAIPDNMDLTFLKDQMQGLVSSVIGVTPTVELNAAPSDNYMSATQHAAWLQARQEAITSRETDLARLMQANATISTLRQVIAQYEAFMRQHGWVPE